MNEAAIESEVGGLQSRRGAGRKWLRRAGWITLGTAGSLTLLLGAASYPLSGLLIRPRLKRLSHLRRPHLRNLFDRLGIEFEDVEFSSFDGTRLYGWWMPVAEDAPTIAVLHGVKKNRTDVMRASVILRNHGFNVLVFDGRGHGNSEGRYVTYGFHEARDVESAIEWLIKEKKVDQTRLGLAGESMGAAIALQVAARNPWISAIWADSPFASLRRITSEFVQKVTHLPPAVLTPVLWSAIQMANYRGKFDLDAVNPLELACQIKCPVVLVHGTSDDLIATEHSKNIYDALGSQNREFWLVEGARHAKSIRKAKVEYRRRLVEFFEKTLVNRDEEKISA
jgi:dipeptidyl aminopeptidase/acylaminoacyl peptidase